MRWEGEKREKEKEKEREGDMERGGGMERGGDVERGGRGEMESKRDEQMEETHGQNAPHEEYASAEYWDKRYTKYFPPFLPSPPFSLLLLLLVFLFSFIYYLLIMKQTSSTIGLVPELQQSETNYSQKGSSSSQDFSRRMWQLTYVRGRDVKRRRGREGRERVIVRGN